MIYPVTLQTVGLVVGVLLLLSHGFALLQTDLVQAKLREFPRSRAVGTVLIIVAGLWTFLLIQHMDLGEFSHLRKFMLPAIIISTFLAWRYMEEFLAVRALGCLALLAAEIVLEATYLRPENSRLLLVVLAYAWIIAGLFWVGIPWLMRDQITWVTAHKARLRTAAAVGTIYGAAILVCALLFWR